MKKFIVSLAIGLMVALPVASQAATCPAGQHWNATKGVCETPSGGAPLHRLPAVYNNWDYFNSPAPVYGGANVWVSTNQWDTATLYLTNGVQDFVLTDNNKVFVHYFRINHLPDDEYTAKLCTNSYMGIVCGTPFTFEKK